MTVTAAQVKELRDKTGAGMLDAKNALVESGGDMEKASEWLRQKGLATAAKKGGRTAAEGLVSAKVSDCGQSGVLLELNCETDFVAKGDAFTALSNQFTEKLLAEKPAGLDAFLAVSHNSGTVGDFVTESIAQIKENISVRRFDVFDVSGTGLVNSYIHTGGKIGVMIELSFANADNASNDTLKQLAKDLCMQIASAGAEFVSMDDIPAQVIDDEKRIEMGKEDLQNKPEEIRAKIVDGRVHKMMKQRVLLEQDFVKDPSKSVADYLKDVSAQVGDEVGVTRFVRFILGEGIEKKVDNFAEEVMAQVAG